jgi:hypothetical protein
MQHSVKVKDVTTCWHQTNNCSAHSQPEYLCSNMFPLLSICALFIYIVFHFLCNRGPSPPCYWSISFLLDWICVYSSIECLPLASLLETHKIRDNCCITTYWVHTRCLGHSRPNNYTYNYINNCHLSVTPYFSLFIHTNVCAHTDLLCNVHTPLRLSSTYFNSQFLNVALDTILIKLYTLKIGSGHNVWLCYYLSPSFRSTRNISCLKKWSNKLCYWHGTSLPRRELNIGENGLNHWFIQPIFISLNKK